MIKLEYLSREDFPRIVEWNKNTPADFLLQWSGSIYNYPLTEDQLVTRFTPPVNKEGAELFVYKAILEESGEMVGIIEICRVDMRNRSARLSRLLIEEKMRGRGIGRSVIEEALRICFQEMKLHRVNFEVYTHHEKAIRLYEDIGFKREGLFRDVKKASEGYWSSYGMSMLEDEWRK